MFARETFTLWCEFADLPHLLTHLEENYARWKEQSTEWDPKKNNTNLLSRSRLDNLRWKKVKTRHCLYAGILVTVIFPALTFLLFFFVHLSSFGIICVKINIQLCILHFILKTLLSQCFYFQLDVHLFSILFSKSSTIFSPFLSINPIPIWPSNIMAQWKLICCDAKRKKFGN